MQEQRVNAVNPATGKRALGIYSHTINKIRFEPKANYARWYSLEEVKKLGTVEFREILST